MLERESIDESRIISSVVFGNFDWIHIKGNYSVNEDEAIESEKGEKLIFELSTKKIRRKEVGVYKIKNKSSLKESTLYELERERKDEKELLSKYIDKVEGKEYIFLEKLPFGYVIWFALI